MFNRKLEDRLDDIEKSVDDVFFWIFIVGLLLGFTILKFNQSSSQVSSNSTTETAQTSTFKPDKNAPKFIYPLPQKVAVGSGFGMRTHPVTGKQQMHSGVDMGAPSGTPIYAVADGVIESSGELGNCGNGIRINHSGGYMSVYCHASKLLVKVGQSIKSGETIALVGSTGMSTGPHLHIGVKLNGEWIDPKKVIPLE
jgi:murein DD-endopeptidase MepM/ murein hydrolase activator NlpD